MKCLEIRNLHVSVEDKEILKGVDLTVSSGEIHALMGPNGNGKSTLLMTIMGHPAYTVTEGSISLDGQDLLAMSVDQRSKAGLFLGMQYPQTIDGVTNSDFLKAAVNAHRQEPISLFTFIRQMDKAFSDLGMKDDLAHRYMNEGFSGGEKKRNEIVQMKLLKPDLAMLDEIDSGLDIDALKIVADNINEMHETGGMAAVIVSHYERFLEYLKPQFVHVLVDGRIVAQGGYELVEKIDAEGYEWLKAQNVEFRKEEAPVRVSLGSCAVNQKGRKNGNG
ncbi:MAG: Fe-S cluster assembly ATPase SufC [Erysipelotrichaceae bacterium]|nr:Fe-S cluster assembly ATPase SufC [Erysipelotrichaceae bacterium]